MNFRTLGAILKKDVLSHAPIVALIALLFLADALIDRLDLLPVWSMYKTPVILAALFVLLLSVFQNDSPVSLSDDWLCRPVPKLELIAAKLTLVLACVYLPRAAGTFVADLAQGFPLMEAFPDAVLLHDWITLFALPILLFTAIVTRTLIQGFGVLFAIFLCVFALPTPFVRPPGPLSPGIAEELLSSSGMQWLAESPAMFASVVILVTGFWLVYWRRRITTARVLMALLVGVTVLSVLLPTWLMPWKTTFAIQAAFGPAPGAETAGISLRNTRDCFTAARRGVLATDAVFAAATRGTGDRLWEDEALRNIGPESVAFLTNIETRGVPVDWRVKVSYVQADYSAGGPTLYSLRPARYITDGRGGGALSHAWMLPEDAVQKLRSARPHLELTYSLSLLRPHNYLVPADGKRHALRGLGYCSAKVDEPGNRIEVDCFSAFAHSAQISAELNEISASRVYSRANFTPAFAQWQFGNRVKLSIGSPRLARHDSITVTSWDVASHFEKSMTFPGILGADLETCPLPTSQGDGFQKARWRDAAPHEPSSITVEEGVQLEVLDFGGDGSPGKSTILLLPGLGATAHSYDELAPLLAHKHRVVAMTRRGAGYSSKPDFGFDTPRLAQDVLQVMDTMHLEKVLLVGHSIAGDELTWLGGHHPERFSALVYLDAAYDRSHDPTNPASMRLRELSRSLPSEPPIPPQALLNFDAMTKMLLERGHERLPEGELIAFRRVTDPYFAGSPNIDLRTQQAIAAAIQAPDYAAVKIPALAIYAIADPNESLPPWCDANDKQAMANMKERARIRRAIQRESIELFRHGVEKGQVLEMQNASHYIFQSNQQEVLKAIDTFADGLPPN